ncbi:MAG: GNAT family N-acetyltransferase [bacterium]
MILNISSLSEFERIKEDWDDLYNSSGIHNLFITHNWLEKWIQYFGDNRWTALLEQPSREKNLLWATILRLGKKRVGFIEPHHSFFPGILHLKEERLALQGTLSYIRSKYRPRVISLIQCPREGTLLKEIRLASRRNWYSLEKTPQLVWSINLNGNYESYLSSKSKGTRHELTRKNRKIERDFRSSLCRIDNSSQINELFNIVGEVEKDSWKFRDGTAIISSEMEKNFYKDIFGTYSSQSQARAYVLFANDIPVSYVFGIVFEGIYYTLKTSYKEEYAKYSPGTVLFLKMIKELCSNNDGITKIEFLGGESRWKQELATDERSYCTCSLYTRGFPSLLYITAYKYIRPRIKKMLKR